MTGAPMSGARRGGGRWFDLGWSLLLAVVVLGPALLVPGFALRGDLVFVPEQPWKDAWLGLDGSVPRAVPMDALVSLASQVLPGQVVEKAMLTGVLLLAGLGAGRLVRGRPWYSRAAAITIFVWNPWVAERLLIGQWAILGGYAVLPWVVLGAAAVRDRRPRGWCRLYPALLVAAVFSPSSGLMAALVALAVVLARPSGRALAVVVGSSAVANLPWLVPSLLVPGGLAGGRSEAFAAFAARGESPLGLLPSLLSLGGIWKTSVVPGERTHAVVVLAGCALTLAAVAAVVAGARQRVVPREERDTARGLLGVAAVALLVAGLPGIPAVAELLDEAATALPPLAILRDSHRYLAPAALVLVPGTAAVTTWLVARARPGREAVGLVAALVVAAPMLLLPSLAWGASGRLSPADYPQEWREVADLVDAAPEARTVVLPWTGSYRGFGWNERRAMLDPAPRYLPGPVVIDDRVLVGDSVIASEDAAVADVGRALTAPDSATALRALGVRWVLVHEEHELGVAVPVGRSVHDGDGLRLVDLGEPAAYAPERPPAWPVLAGLLLALGLGAVTVFLLTGHMSYTVPGITGPLGGNT